MKLCTAWTKIKRWQKLHRGDQELLPGFCLMRHLRLYQCPLLLQPRRRHFEQLSQTNTPFVLKLCHSLLYQSPYWYFHWRRKTSCKPIKHQEDILRLVTEIWISCSRFDPILEPPSSSITTWQLWPLPDSLLSYCVYLQKMIYWQIKGNRRLFTCT